MPTTITCDNCGTVYTDGDFCPTCGTWADAEEFEEFRLDEQPPELDEPAPPVTRTVTYEEVPCPSCGAPNPPHNRHCEECGARIAQGPLPVAPQPLVQMTPGLRALLVIGSVLATVVILAFIVNAIRGGDEPPPEATDTTVATSVTVQSQIQEIAPIDVRCSSELRSHPCSNLIDGTEAAWNDASLGGQGATITFTFAEPVALRWVEIVNLQDEEKFARNFKVRGYQITTDDLTVPIVNFLPNEPGPHRIDIETFATTTLTFEVQSTWPAEPWTDPDSGEVREPFKELAIEEFRFFGRVDGGG